MNKTARSVLRFCVAVRNLRKIPRSEVWACYSRTATLHYSSNTNMKDNGLLMTATSPNTNRDLISQSLSMAKTADDIFNIVENSRSLLKCQHAVQAFKQLDNIYRVKQISDPPIGKRIEFLRLVEILAHNIRLLDAGNAIRILKVLTYFGVPTTSIITQSLLQIIRSSIGQLTFHHLLHLHFQLKDFDNTPLVDALKIAIPIICEMQLDNRLIDISDSSQLSDVLSFLSSIPVKKEMIEVVINALRQIGLNMHVSTAKKILKSVCRLTYLPPGYEEVLHNTQQVLTRDITQLSYFQIQLLLGKIVKMVVYRRNKNFYNEEFVDACAKAVVSEDFGFEEGVKILHRLNSLDHTQIRLIDYLAAKCFENPEILNRSTPLTVIALITGLAESDYKPIFWESVQEVALKNLAQTGYECQPMLLNFAVSLAVLDCFDPEIMKMVFRQKFLEFHLKKNEPHAYWNLLLLYQSVKLLHPTYNGAWPPQTIITAAMQSNGPLVQKSLLLPVLEKAMGGSQYVLSNLKSSIGHHIDHVVVLRKGGYPVSVNPGPEEAVSESRSVTYIEDLQLPAESQVIIIMNLPTTAYSVNSNRMKGKWTLMLKTLELQTGHTVIPISLTMWAALMDHEKIPYLMQAVRLKCDTLSASANI